MAHRITFWWINTFRRATSIFNFVAAQAWSSASVSFVISQFRLFVAAPAGCSACVADSPVMGGVACRAQHQTDLSS